MAKKNLKQKVMHLAAIPLLTAGCMSNDAFRMSLLEMKYERRAEIATPKEHIPEVSREIYKKSQVYGENKVTQETINNFMQHYKNRN